MVIEPAFGTFGSVGRCQVLLENEISISIKLVSRRKHEVLVDGSPNHHWLWKLHTGLQATWILCLSTLPPDSGTLISKLNPVIFLHSPGKMLLTLSLVQKWLGSPFPEDVWAWWLLMHWLQLQSTPCEALTKSLNQLCLTVFSSLRSSLLLVHLFLTNFFLPVNFAFNMLWYSTL